MIVVTLKDIFEICFFTFLVLFWVLVILVNKKK